MANSSDIRLWYMIYHITSSQRLSSVSLPKRILMLVTPSKLLSYKLNLTNQGFTPLRQYHFLKWKVSHEIHSLFEREMIGVFYKGPSFEFSPHPRLWSLKLYTPWEVTSAHVHSQNPKRSLRALFPIYGFFTNLS